MRQLEREIEKQFVKTLGRMNCLCFKFVSPGNRGVPDRLVILPNGKIFFVELKAEGGRPSVLQKWQMERIQKQGACVRLVVGRAGVDAFIREVADAIHST